MQACSDSWSPCFPSVWEQASEIMQIYEGGKRDLCLQCLPLKRAYRDDGGSC
jgi:hypothetical protein